MVSPFVQSLAVGVAVGGAAAYLGSLMITRRMALVGDALGHVALPGMGLALLLNIDPSLGAFAFLALGLLLIWKLSEKTELAMEALVGIVFVSSLALGFLVVPKFDLMESLIGDISKVTGAGTLIAIAVSALTCLLVRSIYPGMMLANISTELAAVEGISVHKQNFLYLAAIALVVAVGIRVTGSLLVGALIILPPATARILSRSLGQYSRNCILIGVTSNIVGIPLARELGFPPGPTIVLVSSLIFLGALASRPARRA